ncbi:MAG: hypothetical protein K2Q12_00900 [Rickettsiales bacterium]|nr:hypothetical protein [Rickettsiales bacterium]
MATIPRYIQTVTPDASRPGLVADTGLTGFGEGAQQAGALATAYAESEIDKAAVSETSLKSSSWLLEEIENYDKATREATSPENFKETYLAGLNERSQALVEGASNGYAREMLSSRVATMVESFGGKALKFVKDETSAIQEQSILTSFDNYQKAAFADPSQIPALLARMEGDVTGADATMITSDTMKLRREGRAKIVGSGIYSAIDRSPEEARSILAQHADAIDAGDLKHFTDAIQSEERRRQRDAERNATAAAKAQDAQDEIDYVASALDDDGPAFLLDPYDKNDRKAVDNFAVKAKLDVGQMSQVAIRTGILPTPLKKQLSGTLINGTPKQQVDAAQAVTVLLEQKPELYSRINKEVAQRAMRLSAYQAQGVKPEQAAMRADNIKRPSTKQEIDYRTKQFTTDKKDFAFDGAEDEFQDIIGEVAVPTAMKSFYEDSARRAFVEDGNDAETAKRIAIAETKATWGRSNATNNERHMMYPPEKYFGVSGIDVDNSAWIREDLNQVIDMVVMDKTKASEVKDGVLLSPDPVKAKTGVPEYTLFYTDGELGLMPLLDQRGQQMRYRPTWKESPEYKRRVARGEAVTAEEQKARSVEAARVKRKFKIEEKRRDIAGAIAGDPATLQKLGLGE